VHPDVSKSRRDERFAVHKQWWRRGELHYLVALKICKLFILRNAINAKNAQIAE
jgi:hypothetical protein